MKKSKHFLVLFILILPMFVLAPSLVASSNISDEVLTTQAPVESNLPAQFVEENLRVAVYAEDNTSLPAYATGGVYTANYQNVIDLLVSAGCAVTALSTQDILDRKLKVADYDAFVLPDQLPRESIINHIKDYWIGGGGILSFEGSIGFCFYAGLIDSSFEGSFMLYPINPSGRWTYSTFPPLGGVYDGINTTIRHPITKSLEDDTLYPFSGNHTILEGNLLPGLLGSRYLDLAYYKTEATWTSIAGFDNPDRGGKIAFITGNCSSFETWMEPVIGDAVDWLAPRPKARILYDLTHEAYYGVDSWDIDYVQSSTTQTSMRNMLVNRSYIVDKLYPPENFTAANLEGYDILVVCDPNVNFTASEVNAVTNWVNAGGSILGIADHTLANNQRMNYLLSNMDIGLNSSATGTNALVPSGVHVTHEGCTTMGCLAPGAVGTAGSAYSIWEDASGVPVIGGDQYGNGRIILIADGAVMRDGRIGLYDNAQALINFANWLSASTAEVLVYADTNSNVNHPNRVPYNGPVAQALNDLGIDYYLTYTPSYFNLSLFQNTWDMVVYDNTQITTLSYQTRLKDFVSSGGKLLFSTWSLVQEVGDYFGVNVTDHLGDPVSVSITSPTHPIFNLPADYGAATLNTSLDLGFGTDALNLTVYANATTLAGYTGNAGSAITLGAGGRVIVNGPLLTIYGEDTDDSTYADNLEIWENEIAFLYFDRPTVNHPADVTYMETETGNEITWVPTADAGPWEYVVRENGSIIESGRWYGGSISINVDGVSVSLTDYQLTVFDRLGYSASDLVVLNVTEYVVPPTTTTTSSGGGGAPLDPTLLLIVAAAGVVIVIIVVIMMKKKK